MRYVGYAAFAVLTAALTVAATSDQAAKKPVAPEQPGHRSVGDSGRFRSAR
jgi:hypothetical protein